MKHAKSLARINYLVQELGCRQAFLSKFDIQSAGVTLKMCQGHQNLIIFAPCLNGVSMQVLVKIHQLVQEIVCRQGSFYSLYSVVTLKIRSM